MKDDNDTRKAVLPIFNGDMDGLDTIGMMVVEYTCSMYYDFLIRQNGKGEKVLTFAITKEVRTLLSLW